MNFKKPISTGISTGILLFSFGCVDHDRGERNGVMHDVNHFSPHKYGTDLFYDKTTDKAYGDHERNGTLDVVCNHSGPLQEMQDCTLIYDNEGQNLHDYRPKDKLVPRSSEGARKLQADFDAVKTRYFKKP